MKVELTQNEIGTAKRQRDARLTMSGNEDAEYIYRIDQATNVLVGKVISLPFTRRYAEIIYRERLISSLECCLPITQFMTKISHYLESCI